MASASLLTAASLPNCASPHRCSLRPQTQAREITSAPCILAFSSLSKRQANASTTLCFSVRAKNREEGEEEDSEETLADALFSSVRNDSGYLWKLAAGSVGGASAIKYGSILLPDITRPNIIQGLLMVSLPVAVAVLILLKESFSGNQDEDQI
ncbi:homoserine O-acetyltransferase [Rhynchospora pubera]|uniref:Homoserine O-acetyltransferase n=1 Tax=Rhynchospora pubera TaxID=906938 RepID=A0AAV8FGQ3_9POAL|nr:homoserine O-acetyltransferase [Rhynchospora pubera]KAJ4792604.1 homoserine O-acetyltransferase [Rhynchospora pubera]